MPLFRGSLHLRHPRRIAAKINRKIAYYTYIHSNKNDQYYSIAWEEDDLEVEDLEKLLKKNLKMIKREEMYEKYLD